MSFPGSEVKIRVAPRGGIGHRRNVELELDVVPPPPWRLSRPVVCHPPPAVLTENPCWDKPVAVRVSAF